MEVVRMELMFIGKFAKRVGVSTSTIRKIDREGLLKSRFVSDYDIRYYLTEQLRSSMVKENECLIDEVKNIATIDENQT